MTTSITGNFLRPLGPSEQYFWLRNQNSAKHFLIAAEIMGDAIAEAWVSAVAAAQFRHPLLRVSIEHAPDGPPCFREHANIPIPLRVVPEEECATWQVDRDPQQEIEVAQRRSSKTLSALCRCGI